MILGSDRLTDVGSKSFSYDASGNTIDDGERQYVYDARNRMVEAGDHEYGYNALGQRVFKPRFAPEVLEPGDPPPCPKNEICEPEPCYPPGPCPQGTMSLGGSTLDQVGWILFQHDDAGRLIGEYDELGNAIRQYVWLDDLPVAMVNGDSVFYLHADHLNTPRVATDAHGDIVWRPILRPFGEQPITAFGELEMPLRFPGQYFDRETGLHQNWHREYAPGLGRYTQADPISLAGGLNVFGYVGQTPTRYIDPEGLSYRMPNHWDYAWRPPSDNNRAYDDCIVECKARPQRYPSGKDWLCDGGGTWVGTLLRRNLLGFSLGTACDALWDAFKCAADCSRPGITSPCSGAVGL